MREEILRIDKVTQKKDGQIVLDNINLHILKGEIMGLIFITAHGKQSLIELLCKNTPIEYGRIYYKGQRVNYYDYRRMTANTIYVIGAKNRLIKSLSVVDNIFVIRPGLKKYFINRTQLRKQFNLFFGHMHHQIDPDKLVEELSRLERCLVELFRAIVAGSGLVIIEDIASYISSNDLEMLYTYIRHYSQQGFAFLYIGNHHEELFQISHRVALMRNARIIKVFSYDEMTTKNISPYTIPFDVDDAQPAILTTQEEILRFQDVFSKKFKQLTFSIQQGECVVLLDKKNDIHREFIGLLQGDNMPIKGTIYYQNKPYTKADGKKYMQHKIAIIDKNPIHTMLFRDMSYLENLIFLMDRKLPRGRITKRMEKSIQTEYEKYVGEDIYLENINDLDIYSLYNLIYYRIHLYNPKILICIQPFTGLDMYLRKRVIDLLYTLKKKGITIIIFTLNLADSLSIADRMLILDEGHVMHCYEKNDFPNLIPPHDIQ